MGLEKKSREDFGQTLGVWGADTGCYFVLPILGPTTTDALGLVGNTFIDPVYYLNHNSETDVVGNENLSEIIIIIIEELMLLILGQKT